MLLFIFLIFLHPLDFSLCLNQEGLYLQRVRQSLDDPANSLSSWNDRDDTPCNWAGISCHSTTGRVVSVDFTDFQLTGPFPPILCRLPALSSLSLENNNLNSSADVDFSACRNLTVLNMKLNIFAGSIPDSLARIPNLKYLDLSANNFSGDIPASFGEFQRLETLDLAGNLLNGTIPPFLGNISTLKELGLAWNPFSPAPLPAELSNLTNLEQLWVSGCNLVSPIKLSFSRMARLANFDLSHNHLTGSIPSSITESRSMVQLELYINSLSGELPKNMGNMTNLVRFDASTNQLTGTIPSDLCELPLESLNLFENRLEGSLPEAIAKSQNLKVLMLFNNKLSGSLPSKLGENSPLVSLDVSYNEFSGEVPRNLCAGGKLQEFVLIYNSFSGKIPDSLGNCESLLRVRLRHNQLSGPVPERFWGLPRVYLLDLVENSFNGSISKMIYNARNLSQLLVSNNQFSGWIPDEVGHLGKLLELSGSGNRFQGILSKSLVKLGQLGKLDLSGNEISSGLPQGIVGWENLNELNLANNRLSGSIPAAIGSLPVLNYLDLSANFLTGKIPLELQNLKLNVLNLSNNRLSGELPPLYAKQTFRSSFLGNPGLCGDLDGLCPNISQSKKKRYLWILGSIFILAGLVFVVGIVWFLIRCRSFKKTKNRMIISKWRSFHKLGFSEFEISDCLKEENLIGSGASGKVYKVEFSNGEVVAVKKLFRGSKKGIHSMDDSKRDEFEVEVETLGKIRHKNIVRLWCCCNTGDSKLLVYEYMPNGSLGDFLHGTKGGLLDWPTRYKIALDAAEGLSYLHHDCAPAIVHRDVKSNNILLDGDFSARVADFGLAKIFGAGNGVESMSAIAGSCGYIAPEYAYTLRVNEKSDIYSFGVVLLELVTGRPPIDPEFGEKDLVRWVSTNLNKKAMFQVTDPKLCSSHMEEIRRVLDIGLLCTNSLPINRPSMRKVVKLLQEARSEIGTKPSKDGKLSPYY